MNSERDVPLTVFKPHVQIYAILEIGSDDYELIGHGFLAIITDQIEDQTVNYMEVQSVKDAQVLLRSRLRLRNNYEKQRGSVIVWNDSEHKGHYDLAISFEGNNQCDVFWRLICEKIGKNYLQISGRDPLDLPNQNNLPYILDKTKTAKDLVEYNLLNSPAFTNALAQVYRKFQSRSDKMGMGMVARIIKSIFSNLDYQMVHALFKDNTFDLLLEVQKFLQDIDFPQCWAEKVRIRSIVPLGDELTQKINIIHRLNFYRQNIIDLMRENYLEHMLVMTQVQFQKEIILHLTKDTILENLIKLTYQPSQIQPVLQNKDIAQQDTFLAETQQIKRQQFAEKKLQFLLEALIISKQIQDDNGRLRFMDKIFRSGVVEMAAEDLDRGILKALDFLVCLAQCAPLKFMDYLKLKYRERPSDNLHLKLSKKYCLGSEQMQSSILEMVKYLAQSFKVKQNIDFFIGTFFASVFGCCKDQKAVLGVLSDIQNMLQNVQSFFGQALKSKVFEKLVPFLRSQKQEKSTELRAIKILKRVLLQNADSSWSFKKVFLDQINQQLIRSGFFQYCMMVLLKNLKSNNVICSSMLENIKIISQIQRYTPFHAYIKQQYSQSQQFAKLFAQILAITEDTNKDNVGEDGQPLSHQRALEQEQEQAYFMSQMQEEVNNTAMDDQINEQLQSLRRMRRQISQQERIRQGNELDRLSLPSKKVKSEVNEQVAVLIQLDLPFDEFEGDK